ncbi:MAG TPA: sulfotransferase [Gaiellaceae bacterium]|nr:sulfotransferase [Gaiellaceae bacterium]
MRAFRVRRIVWRVRRNVPRVVAQPVAAVMPSAPRPSRPIVLIGCPRSGTTALLRAFLESRELRSVQAEGHILWDPFHPKPRHSDALGAEDVSDRERAYVYWVIRLFGRGARFVDKTPENCLRIPYLDALFPDASFVFLRRRAADNVNSLIEGWRARPRFVTHRLPVPLEAIDLPDPHLWSFALFPGWREVVSAPLEDICARQYVACNEAVLAARQGMDEARWVDVAYEELVASPEAEIRRLFDFVGVAYTGEVAAFAAALDRKVSSTALTPPRAEKWREQNADAIARVLPLVAETERRLGYDVADSAA